MLFLKKVLNRISGLSPILQLRYLDNYTEADFAGIINADEFLHPFQVLGKDNLAYLTDFLEEQYPDGLSANSNIYKKIADRHIEILGTDKYCDKIRSKRKIRVYDGVSQDNPKMVIQKSFISEMRHKFPNVNVDVELQNIIAWQHKNPSKAKKYKNWFKFSMNWLARASRLAS